MVNVFLAIIMDAYGQVMGHARLTGAATISDDFHRAMAVTFRSGLSKKFKETITTERMKHVIQIAKDGDILHGITAAESLTDLEMRALRKAFIKRQRPEDDPIADLSVQMGHTFVESSVRMAQIEAHLVKQEKMLEKLVVSALPPDAAAL